MSRSSMFDFAQTELTADSLIEEHLATIERSGPRLVCYIDPKTLSEVRKFRDANGGFFYEEGQWGEHGLLGCPISVVSKEQRILFFAPVVETPWVYGLYDETSDLGWFVDDHWVVFHTHIPALAEIQMAVVNKHMKGSGSKSVFVVRLIE